jgi:hypothetical protein
VIVIIRGDARRRPDRGQLSRRRFDLTQWFISSEDEQLFGAVLVRTDPMMWDTWLFRASIVWLLLLIAGLIFLIFA